MSDVRVGFVGAGSMGTPMVERMLAAGHAVTVYARRAEVRDRFAAAGASVTDDPDGILLVGGVPAPEIGRIAHDADVVLHELTPQRASLEEAFMNLTRDAVEYSNVLQETTR